MGENLQKSLSELYLSWQGLRSSETSPENLKPTQRTQTDSALFPLYWSVWRKKSPNQRSSNAILHRYQIHFLEQKPDEALQTCAIYQAGSKKQTLAIFSFLLKNSMTWLDISFPFRLFLLLSPGLTLWQRRRHPSLFLFFLFAISLPFLPTGLFFLPSAPHAISHFFLPRESGR